MNLWKIIENINLKVAGITNQGNFLKNLGILKRAEIISKNLSFSKKASLYLRVKRLNDKNLMGDLFKVMVVTKKNVKFNIGFENWLKQKYYQNIKILNMDFLIEMGVALKEYIKV